jgi:hypothetical protein
MTTLVGKSTESIEDAVRTALKTSANAVYGQTWMEVRDIRARVTTPRSTAGRSPSTSPSRSTRTGSRRNLYQMPS